VVIIYFDDVDKMELRPQIKAYRTHKVAKQKPAPVMIYDYYDNCELNLKIIFKNILFNFTFENSTSCNNILLTTRDIDF
jgi:hypothetical protein